jgi:hypothetical protein
VDTQRPGPVASGPADETAARAVRREKREAERQERAVWREERAGGLGAVEALRECDCEEAGGNRGRREQDHQY